MQRVLVQFTTAPDVAHVMGGLDMADFREAIRVIGRGVTSVELVDVWAETTRTAHLALTAIDLERDAEPFALLALSPSEIAHVARAYMVATDHRRRRRRLAELAAMVRRDLPAMARAHRVRRVEVRSWTDHPTADRLIRRCGFEHECTFHVPDHALRPEPVAFRQYAITIPA